MLYPLRFVLLVLVLQLSYPLLAQLAIGEWQTLHAYRQGNSVTQSADEIIYSTGSAVFFLDKTEQSTRFLTRSDGLSQADIRLLHYHQPTETLLIIYQNSVIDLYRQGTITTITAIDNFNFAGGDNRVNATFSTDGDLVYLAAGYGVSALDVAQGIFRSTTFTDVPVRTVAALNGQLYAGTEEGIYTVSTTGINLNDFTNWKLLTGEDGFPDAYRTTAMTVFEAQLLLGIDNDIYRLGPNGPELFYTADTRNWQLQYLSATGNRLLAGYRCQDPFGCADRAIYAFDAAGNRTDLSACAGIVNYAVEDEQGRVWTADEWEFIRQVNAGSSDCTLRELTGPYSDRVWELAVLDGELWVATGAVTPSLAPRFLSDGVLRLRKDGQWTAYNIFTQTAFLGRDGQRGVDDLLDVTAITVNPITNKVYAGSWLEGLVEIDPATEEIRVLDEANSSLQISQGTGDGRVRVGGMAVDGNGTLWIPNHLAAQSRPIISLDKDGNSAAYGQRCGRNGLFRLTVDASGNKWALSDQPNGGGLVVFNEGDPTTTSDDQCRSITTINSNLRTNDTRSLAVDLDGDVWVGTADGVTIFECGAGVFIEADCVGSNRVVERDGFNALLLETEDVLCITVDGANRKWIGTSGSGVFLLSPDGREEIAHFTTDNSPLLSNAVRTIAIDEASGRVYMGTDRGIIAYQGDATSGGRVNSANIRVYPNPVRPDYQGPIAIRGLASNANVKITNLNGQLVFETRATGGQAIWEGTDYRGRRVQSGVYLVFSTSDPRDVGLSLGNPDAAVAKVLVITGE